VLFYVNRRFLTVSLPQLDLKSPAFYVKSKEKAFQSMPFEELLSQAETSYKNLNINENDAIFICGEMRFPFQFSLGSFPFQFS